MADNAQTPQARATLLLTRPEASARRFLSELSPEALAGVDVLISPLMRIVPTGAAVALAEGEEVIFTSAQAPGLAPAGEGRRAYCVGARTAEAAQEAGWQVALVAETAADLLARMPGGAAPLVHLAGRHRRGELVARLSAAGRPAQVLVLYDQEPQPLSAEAQSALAAPGPTLVPLFSPRSASLFRAEARLLKRVEVIAISDAVTAELGGFGAVHQVPHPTAAEMRRAVEMRLSRPRLA